MGLFVRQNENRSELQQRIAAELREKARQKAALDAEPLDETKNSKYLQNTEESVRSSMIWVVLFIVVVAALVLFLIFR